MPPERPSKIRTPKAQQSRSHVGFTGGPAAAITEMSELAPVKEASEASRTSSRRGRLVAVHGRMNKDIDVPYRTQEE